MNLLIGLNLIFGQSRENMSIKQLAACQRESKILLNLREDGQNTSGSRKSIRRIFRSVAICLYHFRLIVKAGSYFFK